jgi:hypothetical protein
MTDLVTRVAVNPIKALHVDFGGVMRVFRHTVAPYDHDYKDLAGGVSINARYNVNAGTKLLIQSGFGSGLGRYVGGLVPDAAFRRQKHGNTENSEIDHSVLQGFRGSFSSHGVSAAHGHSERLPETGSPAE